MLSITRASLLGLLIIFVAGCTTTQTAQVATIKTKADVAVAANAKKLHDYCALTQLGMTALQAFVHDPKVVKVLAVAQPAVATYCAGPPPADVAQAVQTLMAIYSSVVEAQAKAGV